MAGSEIELVLGAATTTANPATGSIVFGIDPTSGPYVKAAGTTGGTDGAVTFFTIGAIDTDGTLAANSDARVATQKATKTYADTKIPLTYMDTDGTLAGNSDTKIASQKATKTYADLKIPLTYMDTDGTLAGNSDTKIASQKAVKTFVAASVAAATVGLWDDRGDYDASGNVFPSSGGSGSAGTILKGDIWNISVAGTLGGKAVNIGDTIRALVDTPGSTSSNWGQMESNLGYVPLNKANDLSDLNSASTARTNLGLTIGTNVQAYNANLASLAGLTLAANQGLYATGANTLATFTLTSQGRTFLGYSSASAMFDGISGLTTLGDMIYGGAAGTVSRLAGNTTTTKKFLRQTGDSVNSATPAWDTLVNSDLPAAISRTNLDGILGANTPAAATVTSLATQQITINGSYSGPSWGVSGISINSGGGTYNDATGTGTIALNAVNAFYSSTLTSTSTVTYTRAATVLISGAPIAGANVTSPNGRALYVNSGLTELGGGITVSGAAIQLGVNSSSVLSLNTSTSTGQINIGGGSNQIVIASTTSFSGAITAAAWTISGIAMRGVASAYTDTTSSGTVGVTAVYSFGISSIAASSTVTYTRAVTLYIAGVPTASTNVTIGSGRSIYVAAGLVEFAGGMTVTGAVTIGFNGGNSTNINTGTSTGNVTIGGGSNQIGFGSTLTLRAGTATAGTAPLVFTSGTNLTVAAAGSMEYNGTNLFFTRVSAREGVLTQSAVTTEVVTTDTTVTVNINGTTYKLLAKA